MGSDALVICDYDPSWPARFEAEAERIRSALSNMALRVDHVGSTSVPGLPAKPVIDIQVSVARLEPFDSWRAPLERLGYTHVPHADDAVSPFLHRPQSWPHTHHVHVCPAGSDEERRQLAFAEFLRAHPDAARHYAELKRQLVQSHSAESFESRNAYADAKAGFIEPLIQRALREGYPR